MQRFHFHLQRFLEWQAKVWHREEEKMRLALTELWEADQKLARLKAESLAVEQEWLSRAAFTAAELSALAQYRTLATQKVQALNVERWKRNLAIEEQRKKAWAARRRLEMIQKIRERAFAAYNTALDREAEAIALASHLATWACGRKRSGNPEKPKFLASKHRVAAVQIWSDSGHPPTGPGRPMT